MNKVFGFRGKLVNQTVVSTLIDLRFGQKESQQFITLKIYLKVFMFVMLVIEPRVMCVIGKRFSSRP